MKTGVPWKVKGIPADARETAREAARRSGMSVGEWLNSVIIDSAVDEGVRPVRRAYAEPEEDSYPDDENLAGVHDRLDALTRQLERLAHVNANAAMPAATDSRNKPQDGKSSLTEAIARLDRRLDQLITEGRIPAHIEPPADLADIESHADTADGDPLSDIDRAIAEITARQQALDADPAAPRPANSFLPQVDLPRPATAPTPRMQGQNLSGVERQLRHITTQIEGLHQPRLEQAIATLRGELSQIARSLTEAMPRRAIEALESEVRALAGRFDSSRNFGVDASTLATVENGLVEVRDTLRTLKPAESLVGLPEAVRSLSEKIDHFALTRHDPAAFRQMEEAIATLRGIVSHVASNDALALLAGEVRGLSLKIDEMTGSSGGDKINTRTQDGGTVSPRLEAVIEGLNDKIERLQLTRGDHMALGHLEDRIVKLVEKLDASGTRFTQLEAIERGLADLLVYLETQGASAAAGAPRTARNVDGLQRDIARTQTSLEAVHGTLGHVVDRLATIETDLRGGARPRPAIPQAAQLPLSTPPRPPAPPVAAAAAPPSRATAAAAAAAAMARANPPAPRRLIDPNLPADHPLEPGDGVARGQVSAQPANRFATSEADLVPVKPPVIPDPAGKSNFIAAARRAAQTAAGDPSPSDLREVAEHQDHQDQVEDTLGKKLAHRVRSLLIGASVILILVGVLRVAVNLTERPNPAATQAPKQAATQAETKSSPSSPNPEDAAAAPTMAPAATPQTLPDDTRASEVTGTLQSQAPSGMLQDPLSPALPATRPPGGDKLPAAIGGPVLRTAAAAGTAAAEYEVGVRYAEGRGVPLNSQEAARWLEFAAKQGLAPAQFRLAALYEKGNGVKKDIAAAIRLYTAAAEKGHAKAMHNLAVLYAAGGATKPDYRTAAQWFRKAADYGVPDSQYNLAILYARGIGVELNLTESYKWFALAAAQGDQEAAKKRDEIAGRLNPASLTAARLAVQAWTAQSQPEEAQVNPPAGGWDAVTPVIPITKPKARASAPIKIGGM